MNTFDFGAGPVPAHRHVQGGGWVADTAYVSYTAFIGKHAQVFDRALVCDRARVCDRSRVCDDANVGGDVRIYNGAHVGGEAHVRGHVEICGDVGAKDGPLPPASPLPTDSAVRKTIPLWTGVMQYAPAAMAAMASCSYRGNQKHNPGEPLHHARGKSSDHQDCIARHMVDIDALVVAHQRGESVDLETIRTELGSMLWRAALYSQELLERLGLAPIAPRARIEDTPPTKEITP